MKHRHVNNIVSVFTNSLSPTSTTRLDRSLRPVTAVEVIRFCTHGVAVDRCPYISFDLETHGLSVGSQFLTYVVHT